MSQHLSKLKTEGIVEFRREHRTLYYSIGQPVVTEIMTTLYEHFCAGEA
jgi:ArsR family transcriptional regulator